MADLGATDLTAGARDNRRARVQRNGLPLENPRVLASVAVLGATTLMAEVFLPAGVWTAVLHLAVVFLAVWLARPRDVYILAGIASGLVVAGAVATLPPAVSASGPDLANRAVVLLAIWALAAVLARAAQREAELEARLALQSARLRARVQELEMRHKGPRAATLPERLLDDQDLGHEVRTLLNAIVGFSEAAKQEIFGPHADRRYRDYMAHINESGWALLRLFERRLAPDPLPDKKAAPGTRRPQGGENAPSDASLPAEGETPGTRPKARAVNR